MYSNGHWERLMAHWDSRVPPEEALAVYQAYALKPRAYHNFEHLLTFMEALEELVSAGELSTSELSTAKIAVFYHDAVYEGLPTDEEESAALAVSALSAFLRQEEVATIEKLILGTKHHRNGATALERAFYDGDLRILSLSRETYKAYAQAVRQEYARYSDRVFALGRIKVLTDLFTSDELYSTAYGQAHWTSTAMANLNEELESLALKAVGD